MIFSHELTEPQQKEAYEAFGAEAIYALPQELNQLWSNIPAALPELAGFLRPVTQWLESQVHEGDFLLIQGDFGATYLMIEWGFRHKCIPVYATTERKVIKEVLGNNEVVTHRVFEHVQFRRYERIGE